MGKALPTPTIQQSQAHIQSWKTGQKQVDAVPLTPPMVMYTGMYTLFTAVYTVYSLFVFA